MALKPCPECNINVSDTARTCPSCGTSINEPRRSIFGIVVKWLFIAFNMFMALAMWNGMKATTATDVSSASDATLAGHAVGAELGVSFLLLTWVCGAVILGLLTIITRPR